MIHALVCINRGALDNVIEEESDKIDDRKISGINW